MPPPVPVILFAYHRPDVLGRTLACLKRDAVPLIYAFSDGPRNPAHAPGVAAVRQLLREVDWCELRLTERRTNLGLGKSLVLGITETLDRHDSVLVYEDDLETVPGAYAWLCAALDQYRAAPAVMSVTGWTHPLVTPKNLNGQPYLDGRAECWVWGTWRRAWQGMEATDAATLIKECKARDIWPRKYGDDLVKMAAEEHSRNIWAVRWLYWHIVRGGLCVRPPHSMVEHIGVGEGATNVGADNGLWQNPPLQPCPPIPDTWPEPSEHPDCVKLWRKACKIEQPPEPPAAPPPSAVRRVLQKWLGLGSTAETKSPPAEPAPTVTFTGHYRDWPSALAACGDGYNPDALLERRRSATLRIQAGEARHERDGTALRDESQPGAILASLLRTAALKGGALRVLDFGGGFGSLYFQCRRFLDPVPVDSWAVVEQPPIVDAANTAFGDGVLAFHPDLETAVARSRPDIVLASGVIQLLENPRGVLRDIAARGIAHVLIDRAPFWENPDREDQLTVQTLSPSAYPVKRPAWFFQERSFLAELGARYALVARFEQPEVWRVDDRKRARCASLLFSLPQDQAR